MSLRALRGLLNPAAVVCRVGSGHYTAYGCHEGRWYHFNDSTVTVSSEDTVRKAKAYILFYVERPAKADAAAAAAATAADKASASGDEVAPVPVGGAVKEEDVASSGVTSPRGVTAGAGPEPDPPHPGVTAGAGPEPVTSPPGVRGPGETDPAVTDGAAGGQLAGAGWEEEASDGDRSCEASSDTVPEDSDSLALASAAAAAAAAQ